MKRPNWFHLSLILIGMIVSDVSWSYGHGHLQGYYNRSHGYYSGKRHFSMGIGLTNTFGYYNYPRNNIGIYGSFGHGRSYPYYRRPYYRPYNYGYPAGHFYWPAYPPAVYYPPTVILPPDPPVYIQQQPTRLVPSLPESTVTNYWYYCENPAGYYPEIERCSGEWIKIPPRPAQ